MHPNVVMRAALVTLDTNRIDVASAPVGLGLPSEPIQFLEPIVVDDRELMLALGIDAVQEDAFHRALAIALAIAARKFGNRRRSMVFWASAPNGKRWR